MNWRLGKRIFAGGTVIVLGTLAACAPKVVMPPPPPPPPPPVVVIPPRPVPPLGAAPTVTVPPVNALGVRQTVNTGTSSAQAIWNLRSAYNVAALNCLRPEHAEILNGYKAYLKAQAKGLNAANKAVDTEFRARHGAGFIRPREAYMTQVYNYFAFPPTLNQFCDASLLLARESLLVKPADLPSFSVSQLARLETVYEQFYRAYEQYRVDAAAWDAKYAPVAAPQPVTVPAPVPTPLPAPVTR